MKRKIVPALFTVLIMPTVITAAASVYYSMQARMRLFSGRIEQSSMNPTDPKLFLKVAGEPVGQEGDVSVYNETTFPILANVEQKWTNGVATWVGADGKDPVCATDFVLSSENGKTNNVSYQIVVHGQSRAIPALRFGVSTSYFADDLKQKTVRAGIVYVNKSGMSEPQTLGDGNVAVGEDVKVSVCAWVDSMALAEIGEYDDSQSISVEIIFTAGGQT